MELKDYDFREGYIAVIDKPLEWTSSDVVRKIKYRLNKFGFRKIKVGHAGTLDPLATGILLVCIGKATKQVDALQAERKEYVAELMLGATTPSYDMEHPVDKTYPIEHITREKVEILQNVDKIYLDILRETGWYDKIWQAGAILLPVQSVGVMGDERTYERCVALRAVQSTDGMTADWVHIPYEILARLSNEIINKVRGVNRVVYDISSKPPATIEWE